MAALTPNDLWAPARRRTEPIVSYSQNAEDVRLLRVFGNRENGFYVDVGAGDPHEYSVTKVFYDRGWSGINIEPGPMFERLESERPRDTNINVAVAPSEEVRDFWLSAPHSGLSTLYPQETALPTGFHFDAVRVECRPLYRILAEHVRGGTIDFMSIDVEGAEGDVIQSMDFDSDRPTVLLVEAVTPLTLIPSHEDWEHVLLAAGYEFAVFDGVNRYYVTNERRDLIPILAYPISPLDEFVTASVAATSRRMTELDAENARLSAELTLSHESQSSLAASLDEMHSRLNEMHSRLTEQRHVAGALQRSQDQIQLELDRARLHLAEADRQAQTFRAELDAIYRSRTWRLGKALANVGRPAVSAGRQLKSVRTQVGRWHNSSPTRAYATAVRHGQPWHFPTQSGSGRRLGRAPSFVGHLADEFGPSGRELARDHARKLVERIAHSDWTSEESLLSRTLSWDDRQAIIEADGLSRVLALSDGGPHSQASAVRIGGSPESVVVDARCLQDDLYRTRGVGLHARLALEALRAVSGAHRLVLLISLELPELSAADAALADAIVSTPASVRGPVPLFFQLSPMTATCAPVLPFVNGRAAVSASLLYDFIPTQFPGAYLRSPAAELSNRVRVEALRLYDLLLPISASTMALAQEFLSMESEMRVTGVADRLPEGILMKTPGSPFILVPVGGDPRKNAAAAIAAAGFHLRSGGDPVRVVITGTLTQQQEAALRSLAFQLGFAEDAVELRGYVGSDELANLYRTAEIVLVPSLAEGFSIPVAEAVTRGVPVVASEIPAHRELLGEGPWLAAGTDIRSLAAALAYVLAHRADVVARQRCALGDAATPHRVQDRIEDSLRLLLAATAKPETLRRPRGSSSSRPRIALVSPFPPQRSGVADYTAFTFGHVANYADVAVYSDAFRTDTDRPVPVKPLSSEPYLSRDFDVVVNIIGNSHFHLPILDLLGSYGGATVAHDNRMLEAYRLDRGDTWVARLLSGSERAVAPYEIGDFLSDLDRLPSIGYEFIVRQSSPLIVHGRALAERIAAETGVRPAVVPFVPYRVPDHPLDDATRRRVRGELGLSEGVRHIGTFGIVDRRTKGTDLIIGAIAWLRQWGSPARLHVVGGAVETELEALESLAAELDVSEHVRFYGHVSASDLTKFLQAVDVAVQLRTSGLLSLSGSVADCIAFGLPTVTSRDVAEELDVPSYVVETAPQTSSLLVAEAIAKAVTVGEERRNAIESERREYLDRRSPDEYAKQLLDALDLSVARRA